ncbi:AI-2E family transporter [Halegenticoccus tardaugens]|uniref:AI-2E family transporter n=1 Tax=Halegenticoccus tardaugens TaxID=2071624 RepID=UPI00100C0429|nr:AI-2E family transporter [Halegenticoccus tardaugens]
MSLTEMDRGRLTWWAFGLVLFAALCFVVYSFVGTVVFGVFIYYATRPIYRRIERRVGSSSLAAAIAIFALALPALGLVVYALAIVVSEIDRLTDTTTLDPTLLPGINEALLDRIADPAALLTSDLSRFVSVETLGTAVDSLSSAAGTLAVLGIAAIHLFVMIALAFYLLRDDDELARWISNYADEAGVVRTYFRAVDRDFNSIFFGNILNAVLTGTIGVIAYSALNVFAPTGNAIPAAPLVGLLAGVASLIPVVGMKLVYVPVVVFMLVRAAAVAGIETLWFVLAFAAVSFVVVDTIPDLVLRPYVSGRSLHVGSVMLAYTLGPLLFGWYGIFLMPMLLVLTVHFARIVLPYLFGRDATRPYEVDPTKLVETAVTKEGIDAEQVAGDGAEPAGGDPGSKPTDGRSASEPGAGPERSGEATETGGE